MIKTASFPGLCEPAKRCKKPFSILSRTYVHPGREFSWKLKFKANNKKQNLLLLVLIGFSLWLNDGPRKTNYASLLMVQRKIPSLWGLAGRYLRCFCNDKFEKFLNHQYAMHKNEFLQPAFLHQRDCSKKQPSLRPPFERRIPLSPNGLIDRRNTITLLISHFRTSGKSRNKTLQSNNVLLLCQSVAIKMFIMTTRNKAILDPKKHYKHCANYTK